MSNKSSVSDVWKNGKNVQGSSTLDLVQHLKTANNRPDAIRLKNKTIKLCNLSEYTNPCILDIGCGIGSDIFRIIDILKENNQSGNITGIDFNTTMINASIEFSKNRTIPSNIKLNFKEMNATKLEFNDTTFDIIFISCTLQHISPNDVTLVFNEIKRVLKDNGRIIIVEPEQSALKFYTNNKELENLLIKLFSNLTMANSSIGSNLYWILKEQGFKIEKMKSLSTIGNDLQNIDKDWIKLKGMATMAKSKGIFTEEEANKYIKLYIKAVEKQDIFCSSLAFLYSVQKKNEILNE